MKGKVITICGIDGAGKATQVNMLLQKLNNKVPSWKENVAFSFPQYDERATNPAIDSIEDYLLNKSSRCVHTKLAALPFALDRWKAKETMASFLDVGSHVITDRYSIDNAAYQGAQYQGATERAEFYRWVFNLEHRYFGIPESDIIVFIDMNVDMAMKLKEEQYKVSQHKSFSIKAPDANESNRKYLLTVRECFYEILAGMAALKNIIVVKTITGKGELKSREQISEEIYSEVIKYL